VKLALCQLHVTADKQQNIQAARQAIQVRAGARACAPPIASDPTKQRRDAALAQEAASNGARLVVLPEMWNCPYSNDSFPAYAEDIDGGDSPSVSMLCDAARELNITVVGGSVPERSHGKLYNTCCVVGASGAILAKHRCARLAAGELAGGQLEPLPA
jgi:omega-amidase